MIATDRLTRRGESLSVEGGALFVSGAKIPFASIQNWYFWGRFFFVASKDRRHLFRADRSEMAVFRELFHQARLGWRGEEERARCPDCAAPLASQNALCPDCLAMCYEGASLSAQGRYLFNFCCNGYFDLIGRNEGRLRAHSWLTGGPLFSSMERMAAPFWRKIESHLIWLVCWVLLLFISFSLPWPVVSAALGYLSAILLFLSFSLLCSYGLMLFFRGWLAGRLFAPPWKRWLKRVQSGDLEEAAEELERRGWSDHPGLLLNLARGYLQRGEESAARPLIDRACALAPDHPLINALMTLWEEKELHPLS